ncbi:hypothetical protein ACFOOK_26115 [Micromonospora krabiensis]|uniref:Uncharacterized protein n=1 Tax=Micromonospora krabiensis TaxID=307121 RepID=A0A1C3N5V8_9ACTN|nr:hypothetical protein [Micromonospora krabiensis]SBV27958.1 hypothetical protein GA0070620_3489 [Micromonospora krabiensis]
MNDPVIVDHDAEIIRTGWPAEGEIRIEDGLTTYTSPSGAEWGFVGFRDGVPGWLLFDRPFRAADVTEFQGAYVVTIPMQEAA